MMVGTLDSLEWFSYFNSFNPGIASKIFKAIKSFNNLINEHVQLITSTCFFPFRKHFRWNLFFVHQDNKTSIIDMDSLDDHDPEIDLASSESEYNLYNQIVGYIDFTLLINNFNRHKFWKCSSNSHVWHSNSK